MTNTESEQNQHFSLQMQKVAVQLGGVYMPRYYNDQLQGMGDIIGTPELGDCRVFCSREWHNKLKFSFSVPKSITGSQQLVKNVYPHGVEIPATEIHVADKNLETPEKLAKSIKRRLIEPHIPTVEFARKFNQQQTDALEKGIDTYKRLCCSALTAPVNAEIEKLRKGENARIWVDNDPVEITPYGSINMTHRISGMSILRASAVITAILATAEKTEDGTG